MININKFDSHSEYAQVASGLEKPNVSACMQEDEVHYNKVDYSTRYLRTTALEDGAITFIIPAYCDTDMIESVSYSTDGGNTWTTANNQDSKQEDIRITVSMEAGDKILWKGEAACFGFGDDTGSHFESTAAFNVDGNILSMSYGDDFVGKTCSGDMQFAYLFSDYFNESACPVVDASKLYLPSSGLTYGCYYGLFNNCTSLVNAPDLPATTLADHCYNATFSDCTSLVKAPELPATILTSNCYAAMFRGCTSLTTAPELPATTMAQNCYDSMFAACTSLVKAPELPATTLENGCYYAMFFGCVSLVKAPELPAIVLVNNCYDSMFRGCTSLVNVPELPATTLAGLCYYYMFSNCTSLVKAPELPATTLTDDCYDGMFDGCTSLNYIKAMFTTTPTPGTNYTANWVNGVSTAGTFVKSSAATWNVTGVNGVPTGWDVETEDTSKIVLFIDDFIDHENEVLDIQYWAEEWGYDTAQEYVDAMDEDPMYFGMDMYVLLSYGFEWNGKTYYIWGHVPNDNNASIHLTYMLTESGNYGELYKKSLAYNIFNTQIPYVTRMGLDLDSTYETPYQLLVTVKHMDQNGNVY